jgi:hypothetical protein
MNKRFVKPIGMKSNLVEALENHLKDITGLNHLELTLTFQRDRRDDEVLIITSNELVNYMYPKMLKSLHLRNFGGGWTKNIVGQDEVDAYWLPIHYSYKHFNGGGNGSDVAIFFITPDGKISDVRNELKERV